MEWDAIVVEAVDSALEEDAEAARREFGDAESGALFPTLIIGPQDYRDPAIWSADWRLMAPPETDERRAAEENPRTVQDEGYQRTLRALFNMSSRSPRGTRP
jgi:hypothetical protein